MKVTALVDRFGSNRMNAEQPGQLLRGCTCVNVVCAGGMSEVPHFTANVINVNDADRHVINLATIVRLRGNELIELLDKTPYHVETLDEAQRYCKSIGNGLGIDSFTWAYHYFIASWMTRGGKMGTRGEFDQSMSIRWKSGGGDSVVRFRSATEGIAEWSKVMQRCCFTSLDMYDFIAECRKRDVPENGIYLDRDWPDDGDSYNHNGGSHRKTRDALIGFSQAKIVVRYGDHPLIRELYPQTEWQWHLAESRTQANKAKAEILLTRNI